MVTSRNFIEIRSVFVRSERNADADVAKARGIGTTGQSTEHNENIIDSAAHSLRKHKNGKMFIGLKRMANFSVAAKKLRQHAALGGERKRENQCTNVRQMAPTHCDSPAVCHRRALSKLRPNL